MKVQISTAIGITTAAHLYPKDEWKSLEPDLRRYEAADFDLNEDGVSEILLTLPTSNWCGSGGCTLWVLNSKGALISKTTVVDFPIGISSEKTNGWFDLFTLSNREHHVLKYGKKGYASNASTADVIEEGTRKSGTKKEILTNPFDNYSSF